MAVRDILRMGHPLLWQVAEPIRPEEFGSLPLKTLIQDMKDTMQHYHGAGISAPQIGISKRIILFGFEKNLRYPEVEAVPETILINPSIEYLTSKTEAFWEGCLSVPGLRGEVLRPTKIRYTGQDENANKIERSVDGFHARVVQHEIDHLEGILFPQRITDMKKLGFEDTINTE